MPRAADEIGETDPDRLARALKRATPSRLSSRAAC
jgi:hypothetical protein